MLFQPYQLGDLTLRNRTVMAPLTRCRAGQPGDLPTALHAEYYAQRAGAGLIVSEGSPIGVTAPGYLWTPGMYSPEQVAGWRLVTSAVHEAGGRIFAQLWHCGRISHTSLQPGGAAPFGPSRRRADAMSFGYGVDGKPGYVPCSEPQPLTAEDIAALVAEVGRATANALAAGFDGVEVHGANGYLFDQFLNAGVNDRADAWGGPIENRARFLLEALDAAIAVAGPGRVGVRLSPHGSFNDMPADPQTDDLVLYLADELERRALGYIHFVDPVFNGYPAGEALLKAVKGRYRGTLIACGDMTADKARRYLEQGLADLIAFGRLFISNPDLPQRLERGGPFTEPDPNTFYGGGAAGFTDYPALAQ